VCERRALGNDFRANLSGEVDALDDAGVTFGHAHVGPVDWPSFASTARPSCTRSRDDPAAGRSRRRSSKLFLPGSLASARTSERSPPSSVFSSMLVSYFFEVAMAPLARKRATTHSLEAERRRIFVVVLAGSGSALPGTLVTSCTRNGAADRRRHLLPPLLVGTINIVLQQPADREVTHSASHASAVCEFPAGPATSRQWSQRLGTRTLVQIAVRLAASLLAFAGSRDRVIEARSSTADSLINHMPFRWEHDHISQLSPAVPIRFMAAFGGLCRPCSGKNWPRTRPPGPKRPGQTPSSINDVVTTTPGPVPHRADRSRWRCGKQAQRPVSWTPPPVT